MILNSDLPFLPEKLKINKCKKLACNPCDKTYYIFHVRSLKQELDHGVILTKLYKITKFNQETLLKGYIDTNTKLRTEEKYYGKCNTMENVRKHRDIKLVTTDER